ncbi:hypothetical protein QN386_07595 [Pseudomonas sp. CCI3.2]|uniref:hypothetical protein n=1 Tax=unclassified Pseudomonas TaxID=196821 RepID=UPI002AC9CFDC|nr:MULTISPECIES: hypothetical protein [unclassified Pseudomonas]MEB0079523.1 hypothetical protein [Pseudomonas sp. MH10out]MEB0091314.1 hypothetical protein [Pseudomonas sp. CCI4.2]MEB0101188.1 hypothetical protein [Pseudomonas sp. CCI3.2]MEB0131295.1 hypothetical protein [Pseudomonas sp. CCI2.4]MEB0159304.1 hypothetical protein [Pseudomonas sp. AH2 (2023)]
MKRTLAFGFALSVLAASSAFASPQTTASVAKPVSAEVTHVRVADTSSKTFDRLSSDLHGNVIVAENRKEFGSQYQRY